MDRNFNQEKQRQQAQTQQNQLQGNNAPDLIQENQAIQNDISEIISEQQDGMQEDSFITNCLSEILAADQIDQTLLANLPHQANFNVNVELTAFQQTQPIALVHNVQEDSEFITLGSEYSELKSQNNFNIPTVSSLTNPPVINIDDQNQMRANVFTGSHASHGNTDPFKHQDSPQKSQFQHYSNHPIKDLTSEKHLNRDFQISSEESQNFTKNQTQNTPQTCLNQQQLYDESQNFLKNMPSPNVNHSILPQTKNINTAQSNQDKNLSTNNTPNLDTQKQLKTEKNLKSLNCLSNAQENQQSRQNETDRTNFYPVVKNQALFLALKTFMNLDHPVFESENHQNLNQSKESQVQKNNTDSFISIKDTSFVGKTENDTHQQKSNNDQNKDSNKIGINCQSSFLEDQDIPPNLNSKTKFSDQQNPEAIFKESKAPTFYETNSRCRKSVETEQNVDLMNQQTHIYSEQKCQKLDTLIHETQNSNQTVINDSLNLAPENSNKKCKNYSIAPTNIKNIVQVSHCKIFQKSSTNIPEQNIPQQQNHSSKKVNKSPKKPIDKNKHSINQSEKTINLKPNNVFITFEFDPSKIIHLLKTRENSENDMFVDKYLTPESELLKFSELLSDDQKKQLIKMDSIRGMIINFEKLKEINAKFVGVFGRPELIFEALIDNRIIKKSQQKDFENYFQKNGTGLYLIPLIEDKNDLSIVLILFSENQSDFDDVNEKKDYIRLLRFLTQLSNVNIIAINRTDADLVNYKASKTQNQSQGEKIEQIQGEEDRFQIENGSKWELLPKDSILFGDGIQSGSYITNHHKQQTKYSSFEKSISNWNEYRNLIQKYPIQIKNIEEFSFETISSFIESNLLVKDSELQKSINSEFESRLEKDKNIINEQVSVELENFCSFYAIQIMYHYFPSDLENLKKSDKNLSENYNLNFKKSENFKNRKEIKSWEIPIFTNFWEKLPKIELLNFIKEKKIEGYALENFENISDKNWLIYFEQNCIQNGLMKGIHQQTKNLQKHLDEERKKPEFINKNKDELIQKEKIIFDQIKNFLKNHNDFSLFETEQRSIIHEDIKKEIKKKVYSNFFKKSFEIKQGDSIMYLKKFRINKGLFKSEYLVEIEGNEIIEGWNELTIYKLKFSQKDIERAKSGPNYVIDSKLENVANIEISENLKLVKLFFFKDDKIILICNEKEKSQMIFYKTTYKSIIQERTRNFGYNILLCDFNQKFNQIAFFSKFDQESKIIIFQISEEMYSKEIGLVNLKQRFGIEDVKLVKLISSNRVLIIDGFNKLHLIDHKNLTKRSINFKMKEIEKVFIFPETNCLVFINDKTIQPFNIESENYLLEIENTFNLDSQKCEMSVFDNQTQLIYLDGNTLKNKLLKFTFGTKMNDLFAFNSDDDSDNSLSKHRWSIFDYFKFLYHKFSVFSPMDTLDNQVISQKLIIYVSHEQSKGDALEAKIQKKLKQIQGNIKKPNSELIGLETNAFFIYAKQDISNKLFSFSKLNNMERWVQDLICFVPIKIARTESSNFIILKNGKRLNISGIKNAFQLQTQISFGLYETILNDWEKDIKVITSMGKQSTGKSYTLNHLSGASFGISGGRCTDGCWFTIKITKDCLYILMDFEGLGSFERSEQEDMLLSVMNASLSNITLFKADQSINRETEQMFNRFNLGANVLKGDKRLFLGIFYIIIKDVKEDDEEELKAEFQQKIKTMIAREKEKNFIRIMYKNQCKIRPFNSIEVSQYYCKMEELNKYIQKHVKSTFRNGKDFLDLLKSVMARMEIQDFTTLNQEDVKNRITLLKETYLNAIYFGNVSEKTTVVKDYALKSYDKNNKEVNDKIEIEVRDKSGKTIKVSYEDASVDIDQNSKRFIAILEQNYPLVHNNHVSWSQMYKDLKEKGIQKRIERVLEWINANLDKWSENVEFKDLVDSFKREISHKSKEIEALNGPCLTKCDECYVSCILSVNHTEKHSCSQSSHSCSKTCDYCEDTMNKMVGKCNLQFGHPQKHRCADKPHTCELKCKYKKCHNSCVEPVNHEDDHLCSLVIHHCLEKCSLKECLNLCQINSDIPHQVHKCVNEQCIKHCEVKGCSLKCGSNDHFHCDPVLSKRFKIENNIGKSHNFIDDLGQKVELDFHCCGNVHSCNKNCESYGYCQVITELKVDNKEFKGKRDQFNFQRRYENIGNKLKCCVKIDRLAKDHPGNHIHSNDSSTAHICMTRCPTCNNICEKPEGHSGKHNTAHSNMVNTYFISNQNDVDVGGHKYTVGESSVAEMCHMFCKQLGRGHIHVIECGEIKKLCVNNGNPGMRHETCKYGPNEDKTKDEILHYKYWESIGFEDPCQEIDKEDFNKCPHYCASNEHENETEHRYCQLDIWHKKVSTLDEIHKTNGVVSDDGHYFECSHPDLNHGFLFILCLDDSWSMKGRGWTDLSCAVTNFARSRQGATNDRLTIVQFSTTPILSCRNLPFNEFDVNKHLVFRSGGTDFGKAISFCHQILREDYKKNQTPVFIFMSDGDGKDGEKEIQLFANEFLPKNLKVFILTFGEKYFFFFGPNIEKLKNLARISHGTYLQNIEGIQLNESFLEISSRFRTRVSAVQSNRLFRIKI